MKRNLLLAFGLIFMLTSCTSAPASTAAPTPTPTPIPVPTPVIEVQLQWDAPNEGYSPIPAGEESRYFYDKPLGAFVPSEDYGAVYPYMGIYHLDMWGPAYQYGLCTADGRIITAPVYSAPVILGFGDTQAYLLYTNVISERNEYGGYGSATSPSILVGLDGSWSEHFDDTVRFRVPTMNYSLDLNYPVLAVQRNGFWGGIAMDGTIVVPFEHRQYFRMYESEPLYNADYSERPEYEIVRYDRLLGRKRDDYGQINWEQVQLFNEHLELLAELQGNHYATGNDFFLQMDMTEEMLYTYDYDGKLLGQRRFQESESWEIGISVASDFVMIPSVDGMSLTFCDKYLEPLYTLESDTLWSFWGFEYTAGIRATCNIFHTTDPTTNLHRSYRPDGTRLATFHFIAE